MSENTPKTPDADADADDQEIEVELAPPSGAAAAGPGAADGVEPGADSATVDAMTDATALRARLKTVEAQLEMSFTRARETQERLKDEHERLLRLAAEFDNFKKRALKEKDDARKFGTESLIKDFLPVADNLERALEHWEQHDPKQVIEGVKLVQKMLDSALGKHGVVGFSAVGKPFDPTFHEALMQQDSDEPSGTVVSEMARGYKIHDRLIRPAAVVVARPRSAPAPVGEGSQGS